MDSATLAPEEYLRMEIKRRVHRTETWIANLNNLVDEQTLKSLHQIMQGIKDIHNHLCIG